MSEPLTAEYRLVIVYTVPAQVHQMRTYCEASPSLLAASGYYLFDRDGLATLDAQDCAQAWWTAVKPWFHSSVVAPDYRLENRVGAAWNPVLTGTLTGAGTASGTPNYASQVTVSMRSTAFTRLRLILLEQSIMIAAQKQIGYGGLHAQQASLPEAIAGVDGNANGYFKWARSKNKKMLNATAPIISTPYDLNDRVRRSRSVQ